MKTKAVILKAMLTLMIFVGWGMASAVMAAESNFEVVYPIGKPTISKQPPAPRLDTIEGKTICELWNGMFHGDKTFPVIQELLKKRYPGVKFISYAQFGSTHSATEAKDIAALPEKLKKALCDAVISGNGG